MIFGVTDYSFVYLGMELASHKLLIMSGGVRFTVTLGLRMEKKKSDPSRIRTL